MSSLAPQFESISSSAFFMVGPILTFIHGYIQTIALTVQTFVSKEMSLLFNILSRFVIAFHPRSKHLLILRLRSPSAVILEPKKINLLLFPLFPQLLPWSYGTKYHDLSFLNVEFKANFFTLLFHFHQESLYFFFTFCH